MTVHDRPIAGFKVAPDKPCTRVWQQPHMVTPLVNGLVTPSTEAR